MFRGHVVRLVLTSEQEARLDAQAHAARALWNLLHEWWLLGGRDRMPSLTQADEAIRLARREIPWLGELPAQASQQVLRTYYRAWQRCWSGAANPPGFKGRSGARLTVDNPQAASLHIGRLSRRVGEFTAMKVGRVRFRWDRPVPGVNGAPGRVTGARLFRDDLGWCASLRVELDRDEPPAHPGDPVGVDRGVRVSLALSDGTFRTHRPWLTPGEDRRLLRIQRQASRKLRRKPKGEPPSRRLAAAYEQVWRLRARAKRRRYDWQHKTTTELADQFGLIVVEDLNLAGMTKSSRGTADNPGRKVKAKAGLNRVMLGEAHHRTVVLLEYKLADRGGILVKVNPAHTSTRCSMCGFPGDRRAAGFSCGQCGWTGHADTNAARNILAAGSAVTGRGAVAVGRGREAPTSHKRGTPVATRRKPGETSGTEHLSRTV